MSASRKKSIWIGPPIQELLATRGNGNVSGAINRAISRYLEACARHCPKFSTAEWGAIFDAINGHSVLDGWSCTYIFAEVIDTPGLGEKWGVDQDDLGRRLQALTYVECIAIVDASERFWADSDGSGLESLEAPAP